MNEIPGDSNSLEDLMERLGLGIYKSTKLTLTSVLSIGSETCKQIEAHPLKNVPWYFLQKLMAMNRTARYIHPQISETEDLYGEPLFDIDSIHLDSLYLSDSVNPLDVVCALLHCSDHLLRQHILLKMSMCQFAVPLLVPSGDGSDCTLFLWAMRDIVRKWRPQRMRENKGFVEDHVVNISMPIFSFFRVGEYGLSKSNILNQVLSADGQLHEFFVHENMTGGNVKRLISNGLVEISWYFPAGSDSDLFPDPLTIANLRGDLLYHRKQVRFLTRISTTVFIFVGNMDEGEKVLSEIDISSDNLFFIINITSNDIKGKHNAFLEKLSHVSHSNYVFTIGKTDIKEGKQIMEHLTKLFPDQNKKRKVPLLQGSEERNIARLLQKLIKLGIGNEERYTNLDKSAQVASDINVVVDENTQVCVKTKRLAQEVTKHITDVKDYKETNMKLHRDFWSQLSKNEKEMCRMRGQGSRSGEEYRSHLIKENLDLRIKQYQEKIPENIKTFLDALIKLFPMEKIYFLNWMRFYLDSKLKKILTSEGNNQGQILPDDNLGIEHFLREIVQIYEAECAMVKNEEINSNEKKSNNLPGIAADLLLDGFPLELIDGDASNIPLQWITDVLTELDKKTGGQCRMRVITVLGVQSTGKSTLLNTMFGLQFPVASGRCTRGAFMTLITVKENFQKELGCEFILVIDTEGLKAPELSSLDDSYEHDNELATLVVGLSDITIVNIAMESITDMKDILQTVVHAFLRMREIGKRPNCQFVHQNVSDVSAQENTMKGKKLLLDQLDEMTKIAAKMENNSDVKKFCEIIDYDVEKHNWYIPGLWHGVPPMASVNIGYSENIFRLKTNLLQLIANKPNSDCCNIKEFIEWIKSLWDAVKHEKFIFSFRSSLVADAYNKLCIMYSHQEWQFRKSAHNWMTETENEIKNLFASQRGSDLMITLRNDIQKILDVEAKKMEKTIEDYFEGESKHVKLVEKFKEEFMRSVSLLKQELRYYLNNKCQEVIHIEEEKSKIRNIQGKCQKMIEERVSRLLKIHKSDQSKLSDKDLESVFETMWTETLQEFNLRTLEKLDIGQIMLEHLRKDMKNKPGYINKKLINLKNLDKYQTKVFNMKPKYFEGTIISAIRRRFSPEFYNEATSVADTILNQCNRYINQKVSTKQDYHPILCQQLLNIIKEILTDQILERYEFKPLFELKIKLLVLGKAAPLYQKMHEDFIRENDPKSRLEELKLEYLNTFRQVYEEKDDAKMRAQRFCDLCLKPALCDYIHANLGKYIVDDILNSEDSINYGSRTFFQSALLQNLLEEKKFSEYVQYCLHYESFTKNWITKYITVRYQDNGRLDPIITEVLTCITKKVKQVLEAKSFLQHSELEPCLKMFCEILKKDLVISQNNMSVVTFENSSNPQQFFQYVLSFLSDIKEKVKNEIKALNIQELLSAVTVKPQDELFKKVFGCGKQCPFCKVPCEAGGTDHKEHFASIHRPQGLGRYRSVTTQILCHEVCTTDVVTERQFQCHDTNWECHPYKEYRTIYPDWKIQPDPSIEASVYWKYVLKEFNKQFAEDFKAKEAELPEDWYKITKEQALQSVAAK
ncbi:up-regulator of cell proliferation-like [Leptodactylus fuscus]|uniref:up-regulator of cell proliferation-like n=1 Tax=Leptodactylus fuscus TaxID=238119 RepID=UPI003F4E9553